MRIVHKGERDPNNYTKILGIDSSTLGVAWTLFDGAVPVDSGMINLSKFKEMQSKLAELQLEFTLLLREINPDHIFIEMPIFVKNPDTARKLSFIVGGLMTVASQAVVGVTLVEPATWKAFIGYHNITRTFTNDAVRKLGKTEGKKLCDHLRKEQTRRIIKHRWAHFDVTDDNISDSCAIAAYGVNQLAHQILFEKNKEVAFNIPELAEKGLEF